MRKIVLAMFLLTFAGISLAETPKIINPPRPIGEFKWLIVIDFNSLDRYYIYTNHFYTKDFLMSQGIKGYELIFSGNTEACWDTVETRNRATCGSQTQNTSLGLRRIMFGHKDASGQFTQSLRVLKTKAPKPKVLSVPQTKKPKVHKAKVVFTK